MEFWISNIKYDTDFPLLEMDFMIIMTRLFKFDLFILRKKTLTFLSILLKSEDQIWCK